MDPLSDVLRAVLLNGAFFYVFEGIAPWSIAVAPARELVPRVLPEAEHLMAYHIVTAGSCWIGCEGDPQAELHPGDAVLFPHGDAHLASAERQEGLGRRYNHAPARPLERIRLGTGPGARADLVCGFLGCDARPYNPLLAALPRSVVVRGIASGCWRSSPARSWPRRGRTGQAAAPCSPAWRSSCSSRWCDATVRSCLPTRPDGSPACAILWWPPRWPSCTPARRTPGPWSSWREWSRPPARC